MGFLQKVILTLPGQTTQIKTLKIWEKQIQQSEALRPENFAILPIVYYRRSFSEKNIKSGNIWTIFYNL